MDESLRALQRRLDADPLDPEPARMLARLHLRQGGLLSGRRLDEWVDDLQAEGQPMRVWNAFAALNHAHPFSVLAVPTMLARFGRGRVWSQASEFIAARGRWSLPFLVEALDQDDYMVRARALEALAALGSLATPAFPMIERALADRHAWVRHKAIEAVLGLGASARPFLPQIRAWILDEDPDRGARAILAATMIENEGQETLLALRPFVISQDPRIRKRALLAIGKLLDPYFFFDEDSAATLQRWLRLSSFIGSLAVLFVLDSWGSIDDDSIDDALLDSGELHALIAVRAAQVEARERLESGPIPEADRPLLAAFEEGGLRLG